MSTPSHRPPGYACPFCELVAGREPKRLAVAVKSAYGCSGTSTRQPNEPGGGQDVWHFHVHVNPRSEQDRLYQTHERVRWADAAERAPYAERLRAVL